MAAAAGPGHAPELIAKEVAFGNGQIRKGGNTLADTKRLKAKRVSCAD